MDQAVPLEKDDFRLTGPTYLTAVDWSNSDHKRSVAASLVNGVYTLEHDRRKNRTALAPPWWLFFNFNLVHILVDNHDVSYFGAIYEFTNFQFYPQSSPQYVIAFRGTINKRDFKLNFHLLINNLAKSSRFEIGLEHVLQVVKKVGPDNVWIAGHSLGSSLALLIGRQMIKQTGIHLQTYLFNPPFLFPPIERIPNNKFKLGLRLGNNVITAGLAAAVEYGTQKGKNQENDHFTMLSSWVPYLFINPSDPICSEYEGYFKHREDMEAIGAGKIGNLATKYSYGSLYCTAIGKKDSEAVHLLPCAYLTVNVTPSLCFKEAHCIRQWWSRDARFRYKFHQYK